MNVFERSLFEESVSKYVTSSNAERVERVDRMLNLVMMSSESINTKRDMISTISHEAGRYFGLNVYIEMTYKSNSVDSFIGEELGVVTWSIKKDDKLLFERKIEVDSE